MTYYCEHQSKELRHMQHCNQYRYQCLDCSQSVGDAVSKKLISSEFLETIKAFDLEARDQYWKNQSVQARVIADQILQESEKKLIQRRQLYENHLKSQKWRDLRQLVIERENGVCQGCRKSKITQVHHRNYERLGDELLTDLYGFCESCHKKTHDLI